MSSINIKTVTYLQWEVGFHTCFARISFSLHSRSRCYVVVCCFHVCRFLYLVLIYVRFTLPRLRVIYVYVLGHVSRAFSFLRPVPHCLLSLGARFTSLPLPALHSLRSPPAFHTCHSPRSRFFRSFPLCGSLPWGIFVLFPLVWILLTILCDSYIISNSLFPASYCLLPPLPLTSAPLTPLPPHLFLPAPLLCTSLCLSLHLTLSCLFTSAACLLPAPLVERRQSSGRVVMK